ncbi:MAG: hypothetical protein M4579_005496 [Chaenotheca gracillima]|nr:MAG: hypothetical protein M4579_005496 [Chaenotheca gracillima]
MGRVGVTTTLCRAMLFALPVLGQNYFFTSYETECFPITSTITKGPEPESTVTNTYTSTYCPKCPHVTTTYETVYSTFCPTGLAPNTYTITETCKQGEQCRSGIPADFTSTVSVCTVCGPSPVTATLTLPIPATETTVYTTEYATFCPTGLTSAAYTVTHSCPHSPCQIPTGLPPGFTTTEAVCTECGPTPITATLTVTGASRGGAQTAAPAPGQGSAAAGAAGAASAPGAPGASKAAGVTGAPQASGAPGGPQGSGAPAENPASGPASPVETSVASPAGTNDVPPPFQSSASALPINTISLMLLVLFSGLLGLSNIMG